MTTDLENKYLLDTMIIEALYKGRGEIVENAQIQGRGEGVQRDDSETCADERLLRTRTRYGGRLLTEYPVGILVGNWVGVIFDA